ncbi:hypothetical protein Ddc_16774 [Ditylenchus destructor]|nr:hypothetical protein Ddc_16774 [Ditylenchus destructor]
MKQGESVTSKLRSVFKPHKSEPGKEGNRPKIAVQSKPVESKTPEKASTSGKNPEKSPPQNVIVSDKILYSEEAKPVTDLIFKQLFTENVWKSASSKLRALNPSAFLVFVKHLFKITGNELQFNKLDRALYKTITQELEANKIDVKKCEEPIIDYIFRIMEDDANDKSDTRSLLLMALIQQFLLNYGPAEHIDEMASISSKVDKYNKNLNFQSLQTFLKEPFLLEQVLESANRRTRDYAKDETSATRLVAEHGLSLLVDSLEKNQDWKKLIENIMALSSKVAIQIIKAKIEGEKSGKDAEKVAIVTQILHYLTNVEKQMLAYDNHRGRLSGELAPIGFLYWTAGIPQDSFKDSLQQKIETNYSTTRLFGHVFRKIVDFVLGSLSVNLDRNPCETKTLEYEEFNSSDKDRCTEFQREVVKTIENLGDTDNRLPKSRVLLQTAAWFLRSSKAYSVHLDRFREKLEKGQKLSDDEENELRYSKRMVKVSKENALEWVNYARSSKDPTNVVEKTIVKPDSLPQKHEELGTELNGSENRDLKSILYDMKDRQKSSYNASDKVTVLIVAFSTKTEHIDQNDETIVDINFTKVKSASSELYKMLQYELQNRMEWSAEQNNSDPNKCMIKIKSLAQAARTFLWKVYWKIYLDLMDQFYKNCMMMTVDEALKVRDEKYGRGMEELVKKILEVRKLEKKKNSRDRKEGNPVITIQFIQVQPAVL